MSAYVERTWGSEGPHPLRPRRIVMLEVLRRLVIVGALCALTCAVCPSLALAGNQGRAGINLGATSFFDGFGRPLEGFTYQAYLQYSRSRDITDANGDATKAF